MCHGIIKKIKEKSILLSQQVASLRSKRLVRLIGEKVNLNAHTFNKWIKHIKNKKIISNEKKTNKKFYKANHVATGKIGSI